MAISRIQLQQIYTAMIPGWGSFGFPMFRPIAGVALDMSDQELLQAIAEAGSVTGMVMPLRIKLESESEFWTLPVEPMISLSGKNILVRRNVAKTREAGDIRGTVKERWSTDDYTIQIIGHLRNEAYEEDFPGADVNRLRYYCETKTAIQVECPLFEIFNINNIAIEGYEFPFTPGENVQAYSISAYSDAHFNLLIET